MGLQSEFLVVGRGPKEGSTIWIEYGKKLITVTGWTGSVLRVFDKGKELGSSEKKPPVPDFG